MSLRLALPWSADLLGYNFGTGHPMAPIRARLAMELITQLGLADGPQAGIVPIPAVDDELLQTVHDPAYIAAVRAGGQGTKDERHGLGTSDNPIFPAMHEASALVVGATVAAAQAVWRGEATHAVNIAGGLHHAMPQGAGGFCIYNDLAVAIQWLLDNGAQRVMYVDVDAHHGDGVEAVFWNNPNVLTLSIHQSGATIFPGTGFAHDIGGPDAPGSAVNVAMPPRSTDEGWLRALDSVLMPVAREFKPDIIISQHGADAHRNDPLTEMCLSVDALAQAAAIIGRCAEEVSGSRWVATGGGGYDVVATVPRVWAQLVAHAVGRPVSGQDPTPLAWRELVEELELGPAPERMGEGEGQGSLAQVRPWVDGYDPADPVDQAILATRRAVFPALGLDPMSAV